MNRWMDGRLDGVTSHAWITITVLVLAPLALSLRHMDLLDLAALNFPPNSPLRPSAIYPSHTPSPLSATTPVILSGLARVGSAHIHLSTHIL